jgi:hypothetical protein
MFLFVRLIAIMLIIIYIERELLRNE